MNPVKVINAVLVLHFILKGINQLYITNKMENSVLKVGMSCRYIFKKKTSLQYYSKSKFYYYGTRV